ncbi:MAG: protein kinase [Vicinamibacterales bacterium]
MTTYVASGFSRTSCFMPETLGQYKILDRVGAGRLGEVYRARDTRLGRTVAIRMLAADLAADLDRRDQILERARLAAALSHPNIAALYEIGADAGRPYLVYEFAAGKTLSAIIGGQPLNPRRAIDLGAQIADALAAAHAEDVACGALTAASIVVTPKGNAKILDFGLVAVTLAERAGQAADLSAIGEVLFQMLTGTPYSGTTDGLLPAALDPIVSKAIGKGDSGAYESAATLAAELRVVAAKLDARAAAAPAADGSVVVRQAKRSSAGWVWFAIAAGVLAAAAWYFLT